MGRRLWLEWLLDLWRLELHAFRPLVRRLPWPPLLARYSGADAVQAASTNETCVRHDALAVAEQATVLKSDEISCLSVVHNYT